MKYIKRIFLAFLFFIFICIIFRSYIYCKIVAYKSIGKRDDYSFSDKNFKNELDKISNDNYKIEDIIKISHEITSKNLSFTFEKCESNPNKLIKTKKANCIGYANFYSAVFNYLLKENNLNNWKATAEIGKLIFLGNDVHQYSNSSFFKDHDFVIIENFKTHETYAVDPTIYDYLRIKLVRIE